MFHYLGWSRSGEHLLLCHPYLHQKLSRKPSVVGSQAELEDAAAAAATFYINQDSRRSRLRTRPSRLVSDPGFDEQTTKETSAKYDKVRDMLLELTELCKSEDCAHEQRLLRNMSAQSVVLELLQVPFNKVCGGGQTL